VQYAVCGVLHSNSCCSVLQFAAERIAVSGIAAVRTAVCGSVRLSGGACGSVGLSSGAAVCGCLAVCIFSNKFKSYLHKFVQIRNKSNNLKKK
jgi:hypothetical protein